MLFFIVLSVVAKLAFGGVITVGTGTGIGVISGVTDLDFSKCYFSFYFLQL